MKPKENLLHRYVEHIKAYDAIRDHSKIIISHTVQLPYHHERPYHGKRYVPTLNCYE